MFLKKVDQTQYGDLCASLYNQFTRWADQHPTSPTSSYNTVNEHKKERVLEAKNPKKQDDKIASEGLSFLQHTDFNFYDRILVALWG